MTKRRALFLGRDGTLVHPFHLPSRPEHLQLYANIGPALRQLQMLNFALVVITNQSGLARGYFSTEDLQLMHEHLHHELEHWKVQLDAIYYCPHHPDGVIPELALLCDCRKPQPGMLLHATQDLDLDLPNSWFLGTTLDDVEAGNRAGCHTILVDLGSEQLPTTPLRTPTFVAHDTNHALTIVQTVRVLEKEVDLLYRPATWQLIPKNID